MKKSWKLGFLRTFKIWNLDFFPFSSNIFSPFRFFQGKCDSYGIHVILLLLDNLITKKMVTKNLKKSWKLTILYQIWKILHMLQFFLKILNQEQNIAFIHLVRSGISRWGQNWFCFWCATKTLDFRVKYVIIFVNILKKLEDSSNMMHISL